MIESGFDFVSPCFCCMFAAIFGYRKTRIFRSGSFVSSLFALLVAHFLVVHFEAFFDGIFERFDVHVPFDFHAVREQELREFV